VPVVLELPTEIVPLLGVVDGLAATENETFPLDVPLAPLVMLIQAALLVADHRQPAPVLTPKVLVPPFPEMA
jgi:hypothetical protein